MNQIFSYTEERHEYGGPDPGQPSPGIMQVFYEDGQPHMVDFLCPCGCGHTVPTYLNGNHPKRWEYKPGPTLSPSIRFLSGCKAHFTITNGKVQIHGDSGK